LRDGQSVRIGDSIAKIPQKAAKSRDITGGLPRVAELFEAREPKEPAILASASGRVSLRGMQRGKQVLVIVDDKGKESVHLVPKGRTILVQDGSSINRGEEIVDGDNNPHEILAMRGVESLVEHMVNEVQEVYRLQGVNINDKHIEVIIHQMLRCVVISESGDSHYINGDQVMYSELAGVNDELEAAGKKIASYRHILLGITKASLATNSFISAASFQETSRVLTEAAVAGRKDYLRGLKENVIVGRLVPAGTGFIHYQKQKERNAEAEAEMMMREELAAMEENNENPPSVEEEAADSA
jgi:DNA-directed RNA polymerase subunit beta'